MEVTRENFEESFKLIKSCIKDSAFLAIDAEFTGLDFEGDSNAINQFDTPEERYQKLLKPARSFIIVQFGLSVFKFIPETLSFIMHNVSHVRYESSTFNFYIFPRQFNKQCKDVRFSCQSSSLEFLLSNGMDFGKVITKGISYMHPKDHQKLRQDLCTRHKQQREASAPTDSGKSPSLFSKKNVLMDIPPEHQTFVENTIKRVEEFHTNSSDDMLDLAPCNNFVRKLLYEQIPTRLPGKVLLETKNTPGHGDRHIRVTMVRNEESYREMERRRQEAELKELDEAFGFSKVIELIHKSNKLVVGHNLILDVLHTIQQFWTPLPSEYSEFKEMTHLIFPRIIDTKFMASVPPFKDKVNNNCLADLYKDLKSNRFPQVQVEENFATYDKDSKNYHEAGYDAYVTGVCFLTMADNLASKSSSDHILPNSQLVKPYENKLFLMRMFDVPFMNLAGNDDPLSRDHMFYIKVRKDSTTNDINQLFFPFGKISMKWVSEVSALVSLYNPERANDAKSLLQMRLDWCRVFTYDEYHQNHSLKRQDELPNGSESNMNVHPVKSNSSTIASHESKSDCSMDDKTDEEKDSSGPPACKKRRISEADTSEKNNKPFEEPDWD